jgi:hypothetical protein
VGSPRHECYSDALKPCGSEVGSGDEFPSTRHALKSGTTLEVENYAGTDSLIELRSVQTVLESPRHFEDT